eukprot:1192123-Prorocentrum_minimum.AAC.5
MAALIIIPLVWLLWPKDDDKKGPSKEEKTALELANEDYIREKTRYLERLDNGYAPEEERVRPPSREFEFYVPPTALTAGGALAPFPAPSPPPKCEPRACLTNCESVEPFK